MTLTFAAAMVPHDGYGNCGISLGEHLGELGWDVFDLGGGTGAFPDLTKDGPLLEVEGTVVVFSHPAVWGKVQCDNLVGYTMFESTRIPDVFAENIRVHADSLVLPNEFCRRVFAERVHYTPTFVSRLGVDLDQYQLLDRRDHDDKPYTFVWSGSPDRRKGWDVAYRTFLRTFGRRRDVRLVLHFRRFPHGAKGFTDKNVIAFEGDIPDVEWQRILQGADCFLYPTRGEGHGLPPREAAATGLPVICTTWGGLEDAGEWALPVPARSLVVAEYGSWNKGEIGFWAEPDADAVSAWMLWCTEKPEQASTRGLEGAERVQSTQGWARAAMSLHWLAETERWC